MHEWKYDLDLRTRQFMSNILQWIVGEILSSHAY